MIEVRRYFCYDRVCQIEKQIFGTSSFVKRDIDEGEREYIKELLKERKDLLNASCPDTAENQKRFWEESLKNCFNRRFIQAKPIGVFRRVLS